jgi:lipoate-protein ligase A
MAMNDRLSRFVISLLFLKKAILARSGNNLVNIDLSLNEERIMMDKRMWRLLDTGVRRAAEQMTLDEILLESVDRGMSPNTLRFYRFFPCVLVGYNQVVEDEINVNYCRVQNLDINRRVSGGGAILMEPDTIGWELIGAKEVLAGMGSIEEIYRLLCQGCINALEKLGVKAQFRPNNDIEVDGKKISGTGGTDLGDTFLFHGTILTDFDLEMMLGALRVPAVKLADKGIASLRERLTWLSRELEQVPPAKEIMKAVIAGFEEVLNIKCSPGELTEFEQKELEIRLPKFESDSWVYAKKKRPVSMMGIASAKAPGGLIRVDLSVDSKRKLITGIIITGDFFAYPPRLIADLEAILKNCSIKNFELRRRIEQFFTGRDCYIPGVSPDDLAQVVEAAISSCQKENER